MYVHGGGYTGGSRTEGNGPWLSRLRDQGWVVVSIDYRLAPFDQWPAQPNDVRAAIDWWRNSGAAEFGAPPYPLVGMGWSAGGQLVEWVTVDDDGPAFDAAVSVSGSTYWPERTTATATQALFGPPWLQDMTAMIDASSVTHVDANDPPLLHFHGADDSYVYASQAQLLADVIDSDGDPSRHQVIIEPSCGHSLNCMTPEIVDPFLDSVAGL